MRRIYSPTPTGKDSALSIDMGGFGGTTVEESASAIGLVTTDMAGAPNGILMLNADGVFDQDAAPPSISVEGGITLVGRRNVAPNRTVKFTLANYDAFTDYVVIASGGLAVRQGDQIVFTAPPTIGQVQLSINAGVFNLSIEVPVPDAPAITSPVKMTQLAGITVTLNATAFDAPDPDTHASSDWQIASDATFTTIVAETLGSTTNKVSWTATSGMLEYTHYFARVRYNGTVLGVGKWSDSLEFIAGSDGISSEIQKIISPVTSYAPAFGTSVAMSEDGSTVLIGSPVGADSVYMPAGTTYGLVHSYSRVNGLWTKTQSFSVPTALQSTNAQTSFGRNIDITPDGNIAAISFDSSDLPAQQAGSILIFTRSNGNWTYSAQLKGSAGIPVLTGGFLTYNSSYVYLGHADVKISADGTTVVASSVSGRTTNTTTSGGTVSYTRSTVIVFTKVSGVWNAGVCFTSALEGDDFFGTGASVDISTDGLTIICSQPNFQTPGESFGPGAIRVYKKISNNWTLSATITGPVSKGGPYFGQDAAISGDGLKIATVGIISETNTNTCVYIYTLVGGTWTLQQTVVTSPNWLKFSAKVCFSVDGLSILVTAYEESTTDKKGMAFIIHYENGSWKQIEELVPGDGTPNIKYGTSAAFSSNGLIKVIGASADNTASAGAGAAYFYA